MFIRVRVKPTLGSGGLRGRAVDGEGRRGRACGAVAGSGGLAGHGVGGRFREAGEVTRSARADLTFPHLKILQKSLCLTRGFSGPVTASDLGIRPKPERGVNPNFSEFLRFSKTLPEFPVAK